MLWPAAPQTRSLFPSSGSGHQTLQDPNLSPVLSSLPPNDQLVPMFPKALQSVRTTGA